MNLKDADRKMSTDTDVADLEIIISTDSQPGMLPTDRGWAWVILAGAWLNMFLIVGAYKAFGIVFIEIQAKYHSSSYTTSLITSFLNAAFSITTLLVSTIGLNYFNTRQSVMAGAVLTSTAYILSAFAPSVEVLIFLLGGGVGIGQGFIMAPITSILGQYFHKRRGLANCIAATGGSAGSLLFSFIIRTCLDEYGFSGSMLVLGAINMHGILAGAVMRPTSFYTKQNRKAKLINEKAGTAGLTSVVVDTDISVRNVPLSEKQENGSLLNKSPNVPLLGSNPSPLTRRAILARPTRNRTVSELSKTSLVFNILSAANSPGVGRYASTEFSISSMLDVNNINETDKSSDEIKSPGVDNTNSATACCYGTTCLSKLYSVIDCKVITRLPFLCFLPCAWFLLASSSMIQTFLPPHAKDEGLSASMSSVLITLIGSVDMFAIIIWGVIADKGWIGPHNLIAIASIVLGIATYFVPLYTTLGTFVFYSILYGLLGRVYFSIYPVMLVDFLGLDSLKSALGITILSQSAFLSAFLPVVGLMRDELGTYVPSYQLIASMLVIGGVGITLLPLVEKCERKRKQKTQEDTLNK